MKKQLASELLKVFDTPWAVEVLSDYLDVEIEKANTALQVTSETVEIYRLQGVIRALKHIKSVRTQAENTIKGI